MAPTLPGFLGIKIYVQYLDSNSHKPIFYTSNSYDGSNFIRITWIGNQVEYHTTQNCLECHQNSNHARILNRRRSVSVIIHTLLGVAVFWKVHIQPDIVFDPTYGEIICTYRAVKRKIILPYMEALEIHTGSPTLHWEDNTSFISVLESQIVTPRVKYIDIPVLFLQEKFENGLFIPKY